MENIDTIILKAIGWGIIHSLWIGALIYSLLWIVFRLIGPKPKFNSWIAQLSLLLLLLSFCYSCTKHILAGWGSTSSNHSYTEIPEFAVQGNILSFSTQIEHLFPFVVLLYTLGLIVQTISVIRGFQKLRLLRIGGLRQVPESWITLLSDKKHQLNIRRHIALFFSSRVDVPMVIGHFKPILLFPISLYTNMDMEQVESVLLHELAHIKRNDYLFNMIRILTETLLFFNPFVWLISKILEQEREYACDDLVVGLTAKPLEYSRTLLILESYRQKASNRLAMQAVGKKKQLLYRIQRMTQMKKNTYYPRYKLIVLILISICTLSLAWIRPAESQSSPSPTVDIPLAEPMNNIPSDTSRIDVPLPKAEINMPLPEANIDPVEINIDPKGSTPGADYLDSLRRYFDTKEWKEKKQAWKQDIKSADTTLVLSTMTINGTKRDVEQLLETVQLIKRHRVSGQGSKGFIELNRLIKEELEADIKD